MQDWDEEITIIIVYWISKHMLASHNLHPFALTGTLFSAGLYFNPCEIAEDIRNRSVLYSTTKWILPFLNHCLDGNAASFSSNTVEITNTRHLLSKIKVHFREKKSVQGSLFDFYELWNCMELMGKTTSILCSPEATSHLLSITSDNPSIHPQPTPLEQGCWQGAFPSDRAIKAMWNPPTPTLTSTGQTASTDRMHCNQNSPSCCLCQLPALLIWPMCPPIELLQIWTIWYINPSKAHWMGVSRLEVILQVLSVHMRCTAPDWLDKEL